MRKDLKTNIKREKVLGKNNRRSFPVRGKYRIKGKRSEHGEAQSVDVGGQQRQRSVPRMKWDTHKLLNASRLRGSLRSDWGTVVRKTDKTLEGSGSFCSGCSGERRSE